MKLVNLLFFVLNLALFAAASFFISTRGIQPNTPFTTNEVATLVLACVAIILTALGLFIALLTIWGYSSLKAAAINAGKEAVKEYAEQLASRAVGAFSTQSASELAGQDYGAAAAEENGGTDGRPA